jgi:hypothetical protein
MRKEILLSFLMLFVFALSAFSENDFKFSGEFRIRSELDGRDFLNRTYPQSFTASRIRFNIEKTFFENVTIFLQLQDSRVFGQEKNTLTDLHNVDLHQGYVKIANLFDLPIFFQVGRFKISYGVSKIFGPNDWHNVGRSHDGFRVGYEGKGFAIDGFLTTHTNFLNYRAGAADIPNYDYIEAPADTGFNIYGIYSKFKPSDIYSFDVYGYYEWNRLRPNRIDYQLQRYTLGVAYSLNLNPFFAYLEGAYQTGSIGNGRDIASFMILASMGYSLKPFIVSLNADITSGGKPTDSKYKLFDNPYSTKHNFQGYMDFFTSLSSNAFPLGIYGLNDYFVRIEYKPSDSKFSGQLDVHYFTTFEKTSSNKNAYGPEFDLVVNYNLYKSVTLQWGTGIFVPEDVMKELYRSLAKRGQIDIWNPAFWTYLQLNIGF